MSRKLIYMWTPRHISLRHAFMSYFIRFIIYYHYNQLQREFDTFIAYVYALEMNSVCECFYDSRSVKTEYIKISAHLLPQWPMKELI